MYTGLSAGTELTFMKGTNPYLHSRWDDHRGVFIPGEASAHFPVNFLGYMEVGRVSDSRAHGFARGDVVAASWGHKTGHTANPDHDLLLKLPPGVDPMLGIFVALLSDAMFAGLAGGIMWNLFTWLFGLPSSSSHALFGGLIGSGIAALGASGIDWHGVLSKVIIPALASPFIACAVAAAAPEADCPRDA